MRMPFTARKPVMHLSARDEQMKALPDAGASRRLGRHANPRRSSASAKDAHGVFLPRLRNSSSLRSTRTVLASSGTPRTHPRTAREQMKDLTPKSTHAMMPFQQEKSPDYANEIFNYKLVEHLLAWMSK